jgi:hypothetical protein
MRQFAPLLSSQVRGFTLASNAAGTRPLQARGHAAYSRHHPHPFLTESRAVSWQIA